VESQPDALPAAGPLRQRLADLNVPAVAVDDEEATETLTVERLEGLGENGGEGLRS